MFFYRETQPTQSIAHFRATFDILQAFQSLEPARKMALCDQILSTASDNCRNTVRLLWPQATDADAKQLEFFLRRRMQANAA